MKLINTRLLRSPHAIIVIALTAIAITYALALVDPFGVGGPKPSPAAEAAPTED